ncbi:hypothetical protein [Corynebacterium pelargi]|uniref:Uncharacterized protein n=1 Tax=Corynebacterium pelargi TaxID=1471400 RepID=A0A410WB49_9CORY|nr:hypothetical protein [Corynebacterium pelargi]QAU53169.1 hypothetical protein CPELA_09570 [Corynebacterium pelargi]GGG74383.1 hypothetical protein GCM10007338_09670 [Corynebacterium pelargi]
MKRSTVAFGRIFTFLLAAVLIAISVWAIASHYDVREAEQVSEAASFDSWNQLYEQPWYNYLLFGLTVLFAVLGLWILIANLRLNRAGRVNVERKGKTRSAVALDQIADMTAEVLEQTPGVVQSKGTAIDNKRERIIRITTTVDPQASTEVIEAAHQQAEADIRSALPNFDVRTEYRLHFQSVEG